MIFCVLKTEVYEQRILVVDLKRKSRGVMTRRLYQTNDQSHQSPATRDQR